MSDLNTEAQRHREGCARSPRPMRDSGVEWIGAVPEGWKIDRIGSFYTHRNEKVSDKDYPPLSVTMKGIVPQLETAAKTDDGDNRKLVRKGDFAINSRSDRRGSCGISAYEGSVSLINTILAPRGGMSPEYYNWLFHTAAFADEFYRWGHGIVDDLWTTRWAEMKRISIPNPPLPEQRAIAAYLDERCAKIDAMVADAKKLIEEYKQWKASLIFEAVTGKVGVDVGGRCRCRKMRDSGVEWIGQVPEGWRVEKLSHRFSVQLGKMLDSSKISGQCLVPYLRNQDVQWGRVNTSNLPLMDMFMEERTKFSAIKGDLLVCEGGEIGRAALWNGDEPVFFQKAVMRLRPLSSAKDCAEWMYYNMFASTSQHAYDTATGRATIAHLPAEKLLASKFPFPPLPEQRAIASYLDRKCAAIDRVVAEKEGLIADLEQYKKSLIFECVTGKREVA